jgi:hypothetical protein
MHLGKADTVKNDRSAFEAEWSAESRAVSKAEQQWKRTNWEAAPAALRALAESARVRTGPLLDSGRGFATASGPSAGLFYLGQADAEAKFATLCGSLPLRREGSPLPVRTMFGELQELQRKTNEAFQPPRSIEKHPQFISLNSTIKLADELDAAKLYTGSLYQYLNGLRQYGMLMSETPEAARREEVRRGLEQSRDKLSKSTEDNSIAQAFVQRALARVCGNDPTADDWKSARVIQEQVLPAYFVALNSKPRNGHPAPKAVELTLVRWPYT